MQLNLTACLNDSGILQKKEELAAAIGPDPETFRELIDLSFSRKMPLCWRAAWVADYLSELHPWLADKYIDRGWQEINKKHPDGVTRSIQRMLSRYDIPEKHQGIATDLCLKWLATESVPVAIKAYSMNVLLNIARIYPELKNEFIAVLEEQAPLNSAGFKARAKHILAELNKL